MQRPRANSNVGQEAIRVSMTSREDSRDNQWGGNSTKNRKTPQIGRSISATPSPVGVDSPSPPAPSSLTTPRHRWSRSLSPAYIPSSPTTPLRCPNRHGAHPENTMTHPRRHISLEDYVDDDKDNNMSWGSHPPRSPIGQHRLSRPGSAVKREIRLRDICSPVPCPSILCGEDDAVLIPVPPSPSRRRPQDTKSGLHNQTPAATYSARLSSTDASKQLLFPSIMVQSCGDDTRSTSEFREIPSKARSEPPSPDSLLSPFFPKPLFKSSSTSVFAQKDLVTAKLSVPSPIVRRQTTNGRIVVGLNQEFVTNALANFKSRSEDNIPVCLGHPCGRESVGVDYPASSTSPSPERGTPRCRSQSPFGADRLVHRMSSPSKSSEVVTPSWLVDQVCLDKDDRTQALAPHGLPFLSPQPERRNKGGHKQ